MTKALELLNAAIDANCDAFKIQVFSADNLFANEAKGWKKRLKDRVTRDLLLKDLRPHVFLIILYHLLRE